MVHLSVAGLHCKPNFLSLQVFICYWVWSLYILRMVSVVGLPSSRGYLEISWYSKWYPRDKFTWRKWPQWQAVPLEDLHCKGSLHLQKEPLLQCGGHDWKVLGISCCQWFQFFIALFYNIPYCFWMLLWQKQDIKISYKQRRLKDLLKKA